MLYVVCLNGVSVKNVKGLRGGLFLGRELSADCPATRNKTAKQMRYNMLISEL